MRLVLNEWVAATIQLHFGKATPENGEAFHAFLREIVPLEVIFGKDALKVDPLEKLHPLEVTGGRDGRGFPGEAINHPCSLRPITPSLSTYICRGEKGSLRISLRGNLLCVNVATFVSSSAPRSIILGGWLCASGNMCTARLFGPNQHQAENEIVDFSEWLTLPNDDGLGALICALR